MMLEKGKPRVETIGERFEAASLHVSKCLADGMQSLERSGVEIALVTDGKGRLIGTLTDGDIRRAFLAGATIRSPLEPYISRQFTVVGPSIGRTEVLDLMQAKRIGQIPVVTSKGKLLGLHLLHELLGAVERPNWAVIMAGGKGTRLQPLTKILPKPMIRVAGRPILERIVLHLVGFGIRRIFLSVNFLSKVIEDHFHDGTDFGCRIEYLREKTPLGTGGSLSLLPEKPKTTLVILNGDLVTQADISRMLAFHEQGKYMATVGVRPYVHVVPFGVVKSKNNRLIKLEEKPSVSWMINAGIYGLCPELIARVPKSQPYAITNLIEDCLRRNEPVGSYAIEEDWIDVGKKEELQRAQGTANQTVA